MRTEAVLLQHMNDAIQPVLESGSLLPSVKVPRPSVPTPVLYTHLVSIVRFSINAW